MSAMYAIYHGPKGLKNIAVRVHNAAILLAEGEISNWSNEAVVVRIIILLICK